MQVHRRKHISCTTNPDSVTLTLNIQAEVKGIAKWA